MNRRIVNGITALSLVALIGFSALAFGRRVDVAACERYEQQLYALLALDFRLIAEVMKKRTGLVGHYDGIVQTQAARKRLHHALATLPRPLDGGGAGALNARLQTGENRGARRRPRARVPASRALNVPA